MLDNYLTNNLKRRHFLFFYYLMNKKLEEAVELFKNIVLEKKHFNLLFLFLKSYVKRLPSSVAEKFYQKYPFLSQPIGDEMINENPSDRKTPLEFRAEEEVQAGIQEEIIRENDNLKDERKRKNLKFDLEEDDELSEQQLSHLTSRMKNKHDFDFSSKV